MAPIVGSTPVEALNFYSKLVEPGDLCFDVGANVGDRTAIFLELGATVVAIEPQERCVAELRRRFGRRGDVTVVPAALGSTVGSAPMRVGTASTVSTMSRLWEQRVRESKRFGDTEWRDEIVVPVTTLDLVIADFGMPRFCKIDVEGYELRGPERTESRDSNHVVRMDAGDHGDHVGVYRQSRAHRGDSLQSVTWRIDGFRTRELGY